LFGFAFCFLPFYFTLFMPMPGLRAAYP